MDYYDYLADINKIVCEDSKVRSGCLPFFPKISKAIDDAMKSNEDVFLYNAMRVCALIALYQPFMDGNHRTGLLMFGVILNNKGYNFDFDKALDDMENHKLSIPIIYNENDLFSYPYEWSKYYSKGSEKAIKGKVV